MCGFTLKIFYLILYSGDSRTIVGGEIYYFLYLAIFGFSVEESLLQSGTVVQICRICRMVIWSCENVGVPLSNSYNYTAMVSVKSS